MMNELYNTVIKFISENPKLLEELPSMPNLKAQTMGGQVFWVNIAEYNGWRIQQNVLINSCRILDPNNVRVAWGGKYAMEKAFMKIKKENDKP